MKGNTFGRQDDDGDNFHLRFVISDPDVDNRVLVVHMTTFKGNGREDTSCILNTGEHPSIKNKSYIRYDNALELTMTEILKDKLAGLVTVNKDISSQLLKKIQNGAQTSYALPKKYFKYFELF